MLDSLSYNMSGLEDIGLTTLETYKALFNIDLELDLDLEQTTEIINEEFELQLACDIDKIQNKLEIQQIYDSLLEDFELIDKKLKNKNDIKLEYLKKIYSNLPELLSVKDIAKVYYTIYTFEYIDDFNRYGNVFEMYNKECYLNTLNMSEQTRSNFNKRISEYLDKYKIKKKIFVLESPVDLCFELDMTNNEVSVYHYKSNDMHKNMMILMQYIEVNVKNYVSEINITYSLLHVIWFKKMKTLDIIEEIIAFYTSNPAYQEGKIFAKKHIQILINNFSAIIKQLKHMPIKYKLF
jgi:hypothetical protein